MFIVSVLAGTVPILAAITRHDMHNNVYFTHISCTASIKARL